MAITERKCYDTERNTFITGLGTDWTNTAINPSASGCLFAPTQGQSIFQRIGRQVNVARIHLRGEVFLNPVTAIVFPVPGRYAITVRLILVIDQQTNASIFLPANVINSGSTATPINMFQNNDNWGRYRVLKDQIWSIPYSSAVYDTNGVSWSGTGRCFNWTVNFNPPLRVRYNATNGGTIADIVDNSFNIMAGQDSGNLVASCNYKCRTIFYDS